MSGICLQRAFRCATRRGINAGMIFLLWEGCLRPPKALRREDPNGRFDALVGFALKGFQERLKNEQSSVARYGHADLLAYRFLRSAEAEVVGESLQTRAFAIRKRTILRSMVDVRATAARARDGVGWFLQVKTAVDLREAHALDVKFQILGEKPSLFRLPNIPTFGDKGEMFNHLSRLSRRLLICGVDRDVA